MNYKIYSEVINPWLITLFIWIRTYIGLWVQCTKSKSARYLVST